MKAQKAQATKQATKQAPEPTTVWVAMHAEEVALSVQVWQVLDDLHAWMHADLDWEEETVRAAELEVRIDALVGARQQLADRFAAEIAKALDRIEAEVRAQEARAEELEARKLAFPHGIPVAVEVKSDPLTSITCKTPREMYYGFCMDVPSVPSVPSADLPSTDDNDE